MTTSARPRIALVGAGSMGSLHARVTAQSQRADLALIIDRDAAAARALADRWGAAWATGLDELTGVDAVIVAAATEAHHQLGLDVLGRGLPLLMEKPLADRFEDAEEIVAAAAKADVPLLCGLLERYNPAIMTALALVEEPRHVNAVRHSPHVARIRTGVATDLLLHDIDIALRLVPAEPVSVRGLLGRLHPDSEPGAEDVAEAVLRFADGTLATASASRISQRKVRTLSIAETRRLIDIDMLRNSVTLYRHVLNEADPDGLTYRQQTIIEIPALVSSREPLGAQLDRFLDLVGGQGDVDAERESILPAHRVVAQVRADGQPS